MSDIDSSDSDTTQVPTAAAAAVLVPRAPAAARRKAARKSVPPASAPTVTKIARKSVPPTPRAISAAAAAPTASDSFVAEVHEVSTYRPSTNPNYPRGLTGTAGNVPPARVLAVFSTIIIEKTPTERALTSVAEAFPTEGLRKFHLLPYRYEIFYRLEWYDTALYNSRPETRQDSTRYCRQYCYAVDSIAKLDLPDLPVYGIDKPRFPLRQPRGAFLETFLRNEWVSHRSLPIQLCHPFGRIFGAGTRYTTGDLGSTHTTLAHELQGATLISHFSDDHSPAFATLLRRESFQPQGPVPHLPHQPTPFGPRRFYPSDESSDSEASNIPGNHTDIV